MTLNAAITSLNIDLNEKFNEAMQDKIFEEYLIKVKRKKVIDYLEGEGDVEDAIYALALALEFASVGVRKGRRISDKVTTKDGVKMREERYAEGGESYYKGDGANVAHISPEEITNALIESKTASSNEK